MYTLKLSCEDGGSEEMDFDQLPTLKTCYAKLKQWIKDGEWGDDGASVNGGFELFDEDDQILEEGDTTVEIEPNHEALIKKAGGSNDCEHDWTSQGEGGCTQNPGCWSTGGTSMVFKAHCKECGLHRTEHWCGSQRNPGEHDTFVYEQPERWCVDCQSDECDCVPEENEYA